MSITLDVNAFLNNNEVCTQSGCNGGGGVGASVVVKHEDIDVDDISMEKEMETNIFDEIEHLLKFNKNLEFPEAPKEDERRKLKKCEEPKKSETFSLDFLTSHTDDFLLTSDTQSLLGEDPLLFSVEQDRLQPLTSKFMVPGIYKRIEGVDSIQNHKQQPPKTNVFITDIEKTGRIITEEEFDRLYVLAENIPPNPVRKVLLVESLESDDDDDVAVAPNDDDMGQENRQGEKIPKEWDALSRLAYDILKLTNRDHIVIDRKRNEIVRTQFRTNQKTIYRFWQPEMLGLKPQESNKINMEGEDIRAKLKTKLGRPRKRPQEKQIAKKSPQKVNQKLDDVEKSEEAAKSPVGTTPVVSHTRTRSGRLVRTLQIKQETIPTTSELPLLSPTESLTNILTDLKDSSYRCSKVTAIKTEEPPPPSESLPPNESPPLNPPKRRVPPEAICPTCHKIFLGRRLQRHFAQQPDHMKALITTTNDLQQTAPNRHEIQKAVPNNLTDTANITATIEDMSLFRFLVNKLQKAQQLNEDQKADLFLSELNDLIEQLQFRSSRLIRNTSGLHSVNQRCAKLLGIPEGQYALDLTAIEAPIEPDMHDNTHVSNLTNTSSIPTHLNSRSLDYTNLSITLDDTLTDEAAQKLNLSAGGKLLPPSEESLLRAVDDLVQTNISKIQTARTDSSLPSDSNNASSVVANLLPPHIDHVSDNAVEAVNMKETLPNVVTESQNPLLDLSVDFFQFNN